MKILEADLISSAGSAAGLKSFIGFQIALIGRSNVGKSSLINALIRRKLARTSRAPGKTGLVNVYRVRVAITKSHVETVDLVDLPGYGYARGGVRRAEAFAELAEAYFTALATADRADKSLQGDPPVLHLVDSRHPELDADRIAHTWLANHGLRVLTVGTKADVLPRDKWTRVARMIGERTDGQVVLVSANNGDGLQDLWKMILKVLDQRLRDSGQTARARSTHPGP